MEKMFFAIMLPEEMRSRIAAAGGEFGPNAYPVEEGNVHLTLAFLGETDQVEDLEQILSEIDFPVFSMSSKGVSIFDYNAPRVIFAELSEGKENAVDVGMQIRSKLASEGIWFDSRPFVPHLTIARIRHAPPSEAASIMQKVESMKERDFGTFTCDSILLMASTLDEAGISYRKVSEKKLRS